jgi:hypothetical protein
MDVSVNNFDLAEPSRSFLQMYIHSELHDYLVMPSRSTNHRRVILVCFGQCCWWLSCFGDLAYKRPIPTSASVDVTKCKCERLRPTQIWQENNASVFDISILRYSDLARKTALEYTLAEYDLNVCLICVRVGTRTEHTYG